MILPTNSSNLHAGDEVALFTGRDYTTIAYSGTVVLEPSDGSLLHGVYVPKTGGFCFVRRNEMIATGERSQHAMERIHLLEGVLLHSSTDIWKNRPWVDENDFVVYLPEFGRYGTPDELPGAKILPDDDAEFTEVRITEITGYVSGVIHRFGSLVAKFEIIPSDPKRSGVEFEDSLGELIPNICIYYPTSNSDSSSILRAIRFALRTASVNKRPT